MTDTRPFALGLAYLLTVEARLAEHAQRLDNLEGDQGPPPQPPTGNGMLIGIDTPSYAKFTEGNGYLGPNRIGRTFADPGMTQTLVDAGAEANIRMFTDPRNYFDAGMRQLFSTKPDPEACARGDAQVLRAHEALAASMRPDDQFTAWHEPENDMDGARWNAMFGPLYDAMKQGNPTLSIGYCAMVYQWGPAGSVNSDGKRDAWYTAPRDWNGADDYGTHPYPTAANPPPFDQSLDDKVDWQSWYGSLIERDPDTPMRVIEIGRSGGNPDAVAVRPQVLTDIAAWVQSAGFDQLMYWHSTTGASGTHWQLDDPGSQEAWRAIANAGAVA